jgi:hypothetical protein
MIFQGSPSAAEGAASGEMAAPGASTPGETGGGDGSGHTGTLESAGAGAETAAGPLRRLLWAIAKSLAKPLESFGMLSGLQSNFWITLCFLAVFVKTPPHKSLPANFGIHSLFLIKKQIHWPVTSSDLTLWRFSLVRRSFSRKATPKHLPPHPWVVHFFFAIVAPSVSSHESRSTSLVFQALVAS